MSWKRMKEIYAQKDFFEIVHGFKPPVSQGYKSHPKSKGCGETYYSVSVSPEEEQAVMELSVELDSPILTEEDIRDSKEMFCFDSLPKGCQKVLREISTDPTFLGLLPESQEILNKFYHCQWEGVINLGLAGFQKWRWSYLSSLRLSPVDGFFVIHAGHDGIMVGEGGSHYSMDNGDRRLGVSEPTVGVSSYESDDLSAKAWFKKAKRICQEVDAYIASKRSPSK